MSVVCPSDDNEGPSQLYGHSPWLMYEVALNFKWIDLDKQSFKINQKNQGLYLYAL